VDAGGGHRWIMSSELFAGARRSHFAVDAGAKLRCGRTHFVELTNPGLRAGEVD
jgi:hypothetical protein